MLQVRITRWCGEIIKILLPSEVPSTCALPQKGRMRICCSLWYQRCTGQPPEMGVIKMQDIKAMTILYPYYKNTSGGQGWPSRRDKLLRPVNTASSIRVAPPRAPLCPIVATTPLDLLHVDFTSIETTLKLNQLPRVTNVLVFQDHFTKHVLAYVTPNQTAKTIAKFLYGCYIFYLWGPGQDPK